MGLQVWLPLDGNLNNLGCKNITVTNSGAIVDNDGKIGKCYNFNASSISFPTTLSSSCSSFSVCGWVKLNTGYHANYGFHIVSFKETYSRICISKDGAAVRVLLNKNGTNEVFSSTSSDSSIIAGQWNHYAITLNGNVLKIYINGNLDAIKTLSINGITISTNLNTYIGSHNEVEVCKGSLNDFRLYDHCLSAQEVKRIAQSLVIHYPLNNNGLGKENLVPTDLTKWVKESGVTCTWDSSVKMYKLNDSSHSSNRWGIFCNITLQANKTYTFSVTGLKVSHTVGFGFAQTSGFPTTGPEFTTTKTRKSITITMGSSNANCRIYLYFYPSSGGSNLAYFVLPKLEEGAVETAYNFNVNDSQYTSFNLNDNIEKDISGFGNNGIRNNITYDYLTKVKYGKSAVFNGIDSVITLGNISNLLQDKFTINLWFCKKDLGTKNYETLFGGPSGFEMDTRAGSATTLSLYMTSTRGTLFTPFNFSNWYMVTMVCDNTNQYYYINGNLVSTITKKGMPSGNYFIGAWQDASKQNYKGNISDFRLYTTALSADDIKELYNYNAPIVVIEEEGQDASQEPLA